MNVPEMTYKKPLELEDGDMIALPLCEKRFTVWHTPRPERDNPCRIHVSGNGPALTFYVDEVIPVLGKDPRCIVQPGRIFTDEECKHMARHTLQMYGNSLVARETDVDSYRGDIFGAETNMDDEITDADWDRIEAYIDAARIEMNELPELDNPEPVDKPAEDLTGRDDRDVQVGFRARKEELYDCEVLINLQHFYETTDEKLSDASAHTIEDYIISQELEVSENFYNTDETSFSDFDLGAI